MVCENLQLNLLFLFLETPFEARILTFQLSDKSAIKFIEQMQHIVNLLWVKSTNSEAECTAYQ